LEYSEELRAPNYSFF